MRWMKRRRDVKILGGEGKEFRSFGREQGAAMQSACIEYALGAELVEIHHVHRNQMQIKNLIKAEDT
jgi:hypothetical protein